MSEHHLMIIGADRVDAEEATEVRSPYNGRVLGTVPTGTTVHLDSAIATAGATLAAGVIPTHERASILDRLAPSTGLHHSATCRPTSAANCGRMLPCRSFAQPHLQ